MVEFNHDEKYGEIKILRKQILGVSISIHTEEEIRSAMQTTMDMKSSRNF